MDEFDHLKIQLKDIKSATDNFAPNKRIGRGGFGSVYKGEVTHPEGHITVACKRLDPMFGQGHVEFLKEIVMLSKYKHENLVSLLHFCIEGDERILVYEYASRGSLDCYLSDLSVTWSQRLKICIGVASAINYLHDPNVTHQRILHRDIKSSNILLDEEWNAKVSDFGLSKFGPANQPQTYVVSNVVGTPGYCDPLYWETCILSKESDVYSFGVVLFEVMCGKLCCEYRDGRLLNVLVPMWKKCFEEKRLGDIIFHGLKEHIERGSLNTFSTIAYQCLKRDREERPAMAEIVQELMMALEQQEVFEDIGKGMNFEGIRRIADLAVSPLSYVTQRQLFMLSLEGMLVDDGKTWFSVNKNGQHCELISAEKCISPSEKIFLTPNANLVSRFQNLLSYSSTKDLRIKVKTQFLSPNVTYIINLVYECTAHCQHHLRIPFKYKLENTREYSTSCVARVGEDGWLRTELFQFTSTKNQHYFDIQFSSEMKGWEHWPQYSFSLSIQGIEFCPLNFEKDENYNVDHIQPDWEKSSMTQKDLYLLLRQGVYINNSNQWFSISKTSKKRLMLPARAILLEGNSAWNFLSRRKMSWVWKSLPGSRFKEAAECCDIYHLGINFRIEPQLLSPNTMYTCYLVFKLPENASMFKGIVITGFKEQRRATYTITERRIYLVTPPHTPIIELSPSETPSRSRKIKGHPKLRKDGWMEIQMWEFLHGPSPKFFWADDSYCRMDGYLRSLYKWNLTGLLVKGVEMRPAKGS